MNEHKDFYQDNKSYCLTFIVIGIVCILGVWICHDIFRNEPVYTNTDDTVGKLEERINNLESRLDTVSARIDKAQETVHGITAAVAAGRENAETIAGGIDGIEKRLDDCIQRSGRIANIIEDVERSNKQRAKNP